MQFLYLIDLIWLWVPLHKWNQKESQSNKQLKKKSFRRLIGNLFFQPLFQFSVKGMMPKGEEKTHIAESADIF